MEEEKSFNHPIPNQAIHSISFITNTTVHNMNKAVTNNQNILIFDIFPENEFQNQLADMPFYIKLTLTICIWVSLFVGSFFKCVMYIYVFVANKQKGGWMHRPINVLTISSSIIHHVTHIWIVTWYTIIYLDVSGIPVSDAIGDYWCQIIQTVCLYGMFWSSVGSLGIAIYRILYLKFEEFVKYIIGEKYLLLIVWSLSITLCGIIVALYDMENGSHRVARNMCRGMTINYVQILIEYKLSTGEHLLTTSYLQKIALGILMMFQTVELTIYIWFFYIRYKNDNGSIRKMLTEDVIRARNTKNVTNFLGQFYGFVTEYVFLIAVLGIIFFAGEQSSNLKGYVITAKFMDFGLLSAVEVFASPALRSFMKREV
jgi:hypothetical protein